MITKFKLFENVNLAKSILRKQNIDTSDENYQKILEIAGKKKGWVGFLTKLFFMYNVELTEVEHIFDTLSKNHIDLGKVSKMNYTQLSDYLYDIEHSVSNDTDFKYLFTDGYYLYFEVFTYDGILQTGSPSWCLKTKKNWDNYTKGGNRQFVVIRKGKKLLTPNTNYLKSYTNKDRGYLRYGITSDKKGNPRYIFDDGNYSLSGSENQVISKIISNIKNNISGDSITKLNQIKETSGIIKLHQDKKRTTYYLKTKEDVIEFNNQFPFEDLNTKYKHDDYSINIGFTTNKSQGVIHFTNYNILLISGNIYYGFDNTSFLDIESVGISIKKLYEDKLVDKKQLSPFSILPILVKYGIVTYDQIIEKNDNISHDDNHIYRTYNTSDYVFVIQMLDKKLNSGAENLIYLFYPYSENMVWNKPSSISDSRDRNIPLKEWDGNGSTLESIFNKKYKYYLNKYNKELIRKEEERKKNSISSRIGRFFKGE